MASTHKGRSHPFLPYHKATFPIPGILKYAEIFIALKTLAIVENERFAPFPSVRLEIFSLQSNYQVVLGSSVSLPLLS